MFLRNSKMEIDNLIKGDWYSAQYEGGFSIIFQVLTIDKNSNSIIFCRKHGININSIPSGYTQIIHHGVIEPEYF